MSDLKGTNIAAPVVPFTDQDIYPTHDSLYGRGGWREVETLEERDAIPAARLRNGCVCYVEEKMLPYLYKDGEWVELAVGGGSTSGGITMKLRSTVGAMLSTITGTRTLIGFSFTSVYTDDDTPTGQGMAVYKVNSQNVASRVIEQGETSFDISPYLTKGSNKVDVTVTDSTGSTRSLNYTVEVIELSISSTFDDTRNFDGAITYTYTPMGAITKTVHFILDGAELPSVTTELSNRQLSYAIPAQAHGNHTLSVFVTASLNGVEVVSNELFYDLICIESGKTMPVIACAFHETEVQQYETLNIPYRVYDPQNMVAAVTLTAGSTVLSELQADRTRQTWSYRITQSGSLELSISCRGVVRKIRLSITKSAVTSEAVKEDLELFLTSQGRSNSEVSRSEWKHQDVSAQLTGFNWSTNGWVIDEQGNTALRVSGGAKVYIPFLAFSSDFGLTGKTIELEFSTREVEDYDAVVIESFQVDRGVRITAQKAIFNSKQAIIETLFKEEERVRISFVVEEKTANRLIYTYINGIISGVTQYQGNDEFMQTSPVGITIGNSRCVVDIYNIRVYSNNLNPHQMVDNYIADMDNVERKLHLFNKNQVYNAYGDVTLPLVLEQIPGLVITGDLPQYKGDKKTVSISYTNLQDPSKSFTSTGVELDVQGTSSQDYPRKNYKMKFKSGFLMTSTDTRVDKYAHTDKAIPVNCFTFKADFAESSSTHNTGMANYIEWLLKEMDLLTPPQRTNPSVRTTVEGFPMTIFHRQTEVDDITFLGKYNFNNDKSTMETFGFTPGCESWEFCNNTSLRMKFKESEYNRIDEHKKIPEWLIDFEGRYPDGNTDNTNLKRITDWVVSTYGNPVKFKEEVTQYFDLDNLIFYYLITETFAMIDQRAKNMFLTTFDGTYWMFIFYDNDTCLGINNKGKIIFDYSAECHDPYGEGYVFNGEDSVLWNNLETCFPDEIQAMYGKMRSKNVLSAEKVSEVLNVEQCQKWCEAIYNADTQFKYIDPLIVDGDGSHLEIAQGSREEHRKWWIYNRFRYMDSKYNAGDFLTDFVTMRLYTPTSWEGVAPNSDFTLTPYTNQYCQIKFGSYFVSKRCVKNIPVVITAPKIQFNDTETVIYGADRLVSLGDLSAKYPGSIDVSKAIRLSELIIGSGIEGYKNGSFTTLSIGNNKMLKKLDVQNCPNLKNAIDLSGCENIEEIYAAGTSITSITLAKGGSLRVLQLPETIRNLTIRNQPNLTGSGLNLGGINEISTICIENTPGIDAVALVKSCLALSNPVLERVRITGIKVSGGDTEFLLKLASLRGIDEHENTIQTAIVTGTYHVKRIDIFALEQFAVTFPELKITYDEVFTPKTRLTFAGATGYPITGGSFTCSVESNYVNKISEYVYEITAPVLSTFEYTFLSDNYAPSTGAVTVRETEEGIYYERILLTYIPLRTIRVTDGTKRLEGATVHVNGTELGSRTDNNGQVSLRNGEAITVSVGGLETYSTKTKTFEAVTDDTTYIIALTAKTKLSLLVRSSLGTGLAGAIVTCGGRTVETDSSGEAIFYFLPGTYDYRVDYHEKSESGSINIGTSDVTVAVTFEMKIEDMQPAENGNIQFIYNPVSSWASRITLTISSPVTINWGNGISTIISSSGEIKPDYSVYSVNYSVEISNAEAVTAMKFTESASIIALWSMGNSPVSGAGFFGSYGLASLQALGKNIFKNDTGLTSAPVIGKTLLKIPEGLFDYFTEVTDFHNVFQENKALYSVPFNLFDKCTKGKDFRRTFFGCSAITTDVPPIWNIVGDPDGINSDITKSSCFSGCTNAPNYEEIPAKWK